MSNLRISTVTSAPAVNRRSQHPTLNHRPKPQSNPDFSRIFEEALKEAVQRDQSNGAAVVKRIFLRPSTGGALLDLLDRRP